jgi:hypothetical protein
LVELDGRLEGPHLIKLDSKSIVDDTIEEVRNRLNKGAVTDRLNMIYVYAKYD